MNTIYGTQRNDYIALYSENAIVKAGGGNDYIVSENAFSDNEFFGQTGNDTFALYNLQVENDLTFEINGGNGYDTFAIRVDEEVSVSITNGVTTISWEDNDSLVIIYNVEDVNII